MSASTEALRPQDSCGSALGEDRVVYVGAREVAAGALGQY